MATENTNEEETPSIIIVPESSGGGPRTKEQQERMEALREPVMSAEENSQRRKEIEERLEEIEGAHRGYADDEEREALEAELADLEEKTPRGEDTEATPATSSTEFAGEGVTAEGGEPAPAETDTREAAPPARAETPFDRAMRRLDAEDPDRADRIRKTIGLEIPERPVGAEFAGWCGEHYRRERERSRGGVGSWFKERLKGLGTLGWWEVHQAEKFRVGTREVAEDVEAQVRLIRQDEGLLSEEEAFVEAQRMCARFVAEGFNIPTAEDYEEVSENVTMEKMVANREIENRIVEDTLKELEERLKNNSRVQEYVSYSGERIFTPERAREVEARIRIVTSALRRGQAIEDMVSYKGMIRGALDPEWYKRYVAGGVELALGAVTLKWVVGKMFAGGATEVAKGATEAVRGMKETIWDTTKEFLAENGIGNPTNAQVLEASKMVAEDSGVTVGEWGISGDIVDTKMPGGYLLKFGRVAASLAKIAAM